MPTIFQLDARGNKNYGWLHPDDRTIEQKNTDTKLKLAMPQFKLIGNGYWKAERKVVLWDAVKAVRKKHLPAFYQNVGSCVGQGKGKTEWILMYVEKARLGEREQPRMPYEPYGYAQSRVCAGISGRSDGSTGTGAAEAAKKYGVLDSTLSDLPPWKEKENKIDWPGKVDSDWGYRGAPEKWIPEGQKHLVKTTSLIRNIDEAIEALLNWYPLTIASNWGGLMECPVKGDKFPVLLNRHADTWGHQMMVNGIWYHPELNLIFHIDNSWGPDAHGNNPDDAPPGGFWVVEKDMKNIISQDETYVYSQFDGYPEQRIDLEKYKLI